MRDGAGGSDRGGSRWGWRRTAEVMCDGAGGERPSRFATGVGGGDRGGSRWGCVAGGLVGEVEVEGGDEGEVLGRIFTLDIAYG